MLLATDYLGQPKGGRSATLLAEAAAQHRSRVADDAAGERAPGIKQWQAWTSIPGITQPDYWPIDAGGARAG